MRLFKRRREPSSPRVPEARTLPAVHDRWTPLLVHGTCERLAVGSEHYPNAYRGRRVGTSVVVELGPEPTNAFDGNALMVLIDGLLAGYIGSGTAVTLQPVVMRANRMGYRVQAAGRFDTIGEDVVVRISLPWHEDLDRWLDYPIEEREKGYRTPPSPGRTHVWLKRLGDYQDVLARLLGQADRRIMNADLSVETTPRGKYAGHNLLRATVNGETIGLIPAQYRSQAPELFQEVEDGLTYGEAFIQRREDRIIAGLRTEPDH